MTFQTINHFNSEVYENFSSICQTHILLDSIKRFITNYTYVPPFSVQLKSKYDKYAQKLMVDYLSTLYGYKFKNGESYDPFNEKTIDIQLEKFFVHLENPIIGESKELTGDRPIFFKPVDQYQFNLHVYKHAASIENSYFYNEVQFYLHFIRKANGISNMYDNAEVVLFNKNDCTISNTVYNYNMIFGAQLEATMNVMADMSQTMLSSGGAIPITPSDKIKDYHCKNCSFFNICTFRKLDSDADGDTKEEGDNENPVVKTNDPKLIEAMENLYIAREMTKAAKELDDMAKNVIEVEVIDKGIKSIASDEYKISISNVTTKRLDSTALKTEFPDIYNKFTNESTSNRIMISNVDSEASMEKKSPRKNGSRVSKKKD